MCRITGPSCKNAAMLPPNTSRTVAAASLSAKGLPA